MSGWPSTALESPDPVVAAVLKPMAATSLTL